MGLFRINFSGCQLFLEADLIVHTEIILSKLYCVMWYHSSSFFFNRSIQWYSRFLQILTACNNEHTRAVKLYCIESINIPVSFCSSCSSILLICHLKANVQRNVSQIIRCMSWLFLIYAYISSSLSENLLYIASSLSWLSARYYLY